MYWGFYIRFFSGFFSFLIRQPGVLFQKFVGIVRIIKNKILFFFIFLKNKFIKFFQNRQEFLDSRKTLLRKYLYTINHKKLGLYYFYFALWTGCSGALLATMIRLEMAYPGSPFFKGDSIKYLQVMTAHALIMIFFVVVPIFFGGFANFLLPYHVGSKDVAFPRLNSIGFWIQPCGYLLIAKIGFIRQQYWHYYDKSGLYFSMTKLSNFTDNVVLDQTSGEYIKNSFKSHIPTNFKVKDFGIINKKFNERQDLIEKFNKTKYFKFHFFGIGDSYYLDKNYNSSSLNVDDTLARWEAYYNTIFKKKMEEQASSQIWQISTNGLNKHSNILVRKPWATYSYRLTHYNSYIQPKGNVISNEKLGWTRGFNGYVTLPTKFKLWSTLKAFPENFWYLGSRVSLARRQKRFVSKCSNATQTVAGWTFITPFSSNTRFTGFGVQDMLITGVYFAGISTTISLTNLLVTRRTLSAPGLRNRRVLLPFITISILLMLRALAIITPVLGSAMLMVLLDRHWKTSFFDFSYGGDPILFHHLFWFFGHPEVYVLVIPAFGVVNSIIPSINFRRIASKHHLIWAIYIMNYMGFLVWGHHMYLIGLDHRSRSLYSIITIMISLPATIKVVNWTFSLVNGALFINPALLSCISFIFFFLVAGFTGMWLSHVSLNISMHDTMYVVAHFHLMLSGSVVMSIFAGFYHYFTPFFGIKYSRTWAYFHIIYYTGGQWLTFLPIFWLGFSGLPRRLHDFPQMYTGWQSMATSGHFVTMTGVFYFYLMLFDSHKEKKVNTNFTFGVPRFNKRVLYYIFKISYINYYRKLSINLPNKEARTHIISNNIVNNEFTDYIYSNKYNEKN